MRLGLFMMPLHPSYRAIADGYDRDIDQLVLADKLGFDEAWLGEHFTEKWENAPSPDLLIAKALALTKRIRFGTGVTLLAMHEPVYLAHRVAMLDHLARGRFNWGIGLGGIPTDMVLMGLDPKEARGRWPWTGRLGAASGWRPGDPSPRSWRWRGLRCCRRKLWSPGSGVS